MWNYGIIIFFEKTISKKFLVNIVIWVWKFNQKFQHGAYQTQQKMEMFFWCKKESEMFIDLLPFFISTKHPLNFLREWKRSVLHTQTHYTCSQMANCLCHHIIIWLCLMVAANKNNSILNWFVCVLLSPSHIKTVFQSNITTPNNITHGLAFSLWPFESAKDECKNEDSSTSDMANYCF